MLLRIAGSDVMPESFRNCLYTRRFRRVAVRQTQKQKLTCSPRRQGSAQLRCEGVANQPAPDPSCRNYGVRRS